MEERDERLVDEEENLHEICNQLNEIKRSVDDILQYANNGLDVGEQMQKNPYLHSVGIKPLFYAVKASVA